MIEKLIFGLYVFSLATFVGYQVISRVPPLLHTPLMSGTNAISGISLVGSLAAAGAGHNSVSTVLGFVAVACASLNAVGGFMITHRMLQMLKKVLSDHATRRKGRERSASQHRLSRRVDPLHPVPPRALGA